MQGAFWFQTLEFRQKFGVGPRMQTCPTKSPVVLQKLTGAFVGLGDLRTNKKKLGLAPFLHHETN